MRLRALCLLACWPAGLLACGPKGPPPQLLADLAKAESLTSQGCYSCLKESLAIYERHAAAKLRPAGFAEKHFDTALLIAIREKELGIPAADAMTKALRLLPTVPEQSAVAQGKRS